MLLAIVATAGLIRLAVVLLGWFAVPAQQAFIEPDTSSYRAAAADLLEHGTFSIHGTAEIVRTPGYPLVLAGAASTGSPVALTLAFQIILSCATVALVYQIAWQVFDSRLAARCAGWLAAFEPLGILYTSKLLTETTYTFLLTAAVAMLVRYLAKPAAGRIALATALLVASALVRPISYYLLPVVGLALAIWMWRQQFSRGRFAAHAAVFLVLWIVPVAAWHVRNFRVAEYPGFSAIGDHNLFFCQAASVHAAVTRQSSRAVREQWGLEDFQKYLERFPEQAGQPRGRQYRNMRDEALRIIAEEPTTYLSIHTDGMLRTLADPAVTDWVRYVRPGSAVRRTNRPAGRPRSRRHDQQTRLRSTGTAGRRPGTGSHPGRHLGIGGIRIDAQRSHGAARMVDRAGDRLPVDRFGRRPEFGSLPPSHHAAACGPGRAGDCTFAVSPAAPRRCLARR